MSSRTKWSRAETSPFFVYSWWISVVLSIFVFFYKKAQIQSLQTLEHFPESRIESLAFHLPNWSFDWLLLLQTCRQRFCRKKYSLSPSLLSPAFTLQSNWCVPWKITKHLQFRGCEKSSKSKNWKCIPNYYGPFQIFEKLLFLVFSLSYDWILSVISPGRWKNIMYSEKK